MIESRLRPHGTLAVKHITTRRVGWWYKVKNAPNLWRGYWRYQAAQLLGIPTLYGELHAVLIRADGNRVDYGLISTRAVTDAFVADIVDNLQTGAASFQAYDFHASGTSSTAESAAHTGLQADSGVARVTGTASEPATNQYRSVGTQSYTSSLGIQEHGLFNASTSGTLMDRSVFSAINVVSGDSIQFTYTLTCTSGG